MARGTLQMAWINKGDSAEEQYHIMYGMEGENKTMKARTVRGKAVLGALLRADLKMPESSIKSAIGELETKGTASLDGLDIDLNELKRMDLA